MVFVNLLYKHEVKIYVCEIELKCLPQRNVSKEKYDWNRTGSRRKQKTNEEEVEFDGTIQSIFRTEEDRSRKTLEAEYVEYQPSAVEDPRMVKHQGLLHDFKKEKKTEIIEEVIEGGTSVNEEENAVNNLLKELDCFELKRQDDVQMKTIQTDPEMHPLDPDHLLCCPIHEMFVERKVSQKGWEYIKCPYATCPLFARASDMLPYMSAVKSQLREELKQKWNHLVCCRSRSMTLSVSKSEKNPGRLYLRCNKNQCKFFQWAEVPLTQKKRDWIDWRGYVGKNSSGMKQKRALEISW